MQLGIDFDWTWILNLNTALKGLWETYFHVRVKMQLLLWCVFCVWLIFIEFSLVEKKKKKKAAGEFWKQENAAQTFISSFGYRKPAASLFRTKTNKAITFKGGSLCALCVKNL